MTATPLPLPIDLPSEHTVREYLERRQHIRRLVAEAAAVLEDPDVAANRKALAEQIVLMYRPERRTR